MSLIIDPAVVAAISLYSRGQADVAVVQAKIASAADKKTQGYVIKALFDLSEKKPSLFAADVKWDKRIAALYQTLNTEYIHNSAKVAQVVEKQFIPFPEAPKKTSPLDLDEIVSRLISTATATLTEAHFRPLQTCRNIQQPLEVCISGKSPGVIQSLQAADLTLGRVTSLKITYQHFTSEELAGLVNACPNLDTLYIAECDTFTDATIEDIKWPKKLAIVRIPVSKLEHSLQRFANQCPTLSRLTVYGSDCHRALMTTQWPESLIDICYDPYWADDNDFTVVSECLKVEKPSVVALSIGAVALFESIDGEKHKAIEWIEQACSDNPNFIPAGIAYIEMYRVGVLGIKQDLQKAREKLDLLLGAFPHPGLMACNARLLADSGQHDAAYTQAKQAYELAPHDDYVLATFANILLKEGNTPLARDLCTRALVYNPNNIVALLTAADMDAYDENHAAAEEKCRKAVRINSENQDALYSLAMALELSQEDITEAKGHLDTLVQVNPDSARGHFELAKIYYLSLLDNAKARVHFERAYALQPKNGELLEMYAELLSKGDAADLQLATKLLAELKELTDSSLQSQVKRAKTRDLEAELTLKTLMQDVEGISENRAAALEKCEKAYSLKPTDPTVLCMLGELLLTSDTARGLELLELAAEKFDSIPALVSLGKYYMLLDPDRALEFFGLALKKDPKNVQVNIAVAKFEIARNNHTVAQKHIEQALAIDPNNAQANVVQVVLLASAQLFQQAADRLRQTIANTTFGSDTRQDIVVLLLEDQHLLKQIGDETLISLLKGSK
ncbi:MAG: tetratricopeptide repeat protein [Chlamydiales bacterium]|nr:tetratricopeptide repeat protein [Chlamydiales bacterium]